MVSNGRNWDVANLFFFALFNFSNNPNQKEKNIYSTDDFFGDGGEWAKRIRGTIIYFFEAGFLRFFKHCLSSRTMAQTSGLSRFLQFEWLYTGHSGYFSDINTFSCLQKNNISFNTFHQPTSPTISSFFSFWRSDYLSGSLNIWRSQFFWHPRRDPFRLQGSFHGAHFYPSHRIYRNGWSRRPRPIPGFSWWFPGAIQSWSKIHPLKSRSFCKGGRSGLCQIHKAAVSWKLLIRVLGIFFGNTVSRLILISEFQHNVTTRWNISLICHNVSDALFFVTAGPYRPRLWR